MDFSGGYGGRVDSVRKCYVKIMLTCLLNKHLLFTFNTSTEYISTRLQLNASFLHQIVTADSISTLFPWTVPCVRKYYLSLADPQNSNRTSIAPEIPTEVIIHFVVKLGQAKLIHTMVDLPVHVGVLTIARIGRQYWKIPMQISSLVLS